MPQHDGQLQDGNQEQELILGGVEEVLAFVLDHEILVSLLIAQEPATQTKLVSFNCVLTANASHLTKSLRDSLPLTPP